MFSTESYIDDIEQLWIVVNIEQYILRGARGAARGWKL